MPADESPNLPLEPATIPVNPPNDTRPRLPEPLPVRLATVEDATLPARAGIEEQLDDFYVALLGFERHGDPYQLVYHADNFDLRFEVIDPPVEHDSLKPLGIEVLSLRETELKLIEREYEYERQKGIFPGHFALVLLDPAGNWLELTESRPV